MEAGFGYRFENVRIHTDDEADRSARAYGAVAYTVGSHIAFQAGSFDPSSTVGQRLIAHELTHVLQQRGSPGTTSAQAETAISRPGDASESEADRVAHTVVGSLGTPHAPAVPAVSVRPTSVPKVQRQGGTGVQQQPTGGRQGTGAAPVNLADEAVAYLETMARFVEGLRTTTLAMGRTPTAADRQRTFRILNQDRIARLLEQARSTFEAQYGILPPGDTHRIPLRRAYQGALEQLRLASEASFQNSEAMDVATRDSERLKHLQNQAAWINVVPTTESGLAGATLGADDVALAQLHEQSLEAYLNDLVTSLPTANLTQAQKDDILERIRSGLRRAFVTVMHA